jgi:pyridoxine/pyridoxamine 5'-phosphate oxidase
MAWRECGAIWLVLMLPTEGCASPHPTMGDPLSHRPEPPGVEYATYRHTGRESEHGNLLAFALDGQGLSAATGYEGQGGRSLRSSPRSGKPATWRRETGERYAFGAGGTIRGLGSSHRYGVAPRRATKAVSVESTASRRSVSRTVELDHRYPQFTMRMGSCGPEQRAAHPRD